MVKQNTVSGLDELRFLKERVSQLEQVNKTLQQNNLRVFGDMDQIQERADKHASTSGNITYKDIRSYVPMSLYHGNGVHIGKKVGPIHPSNAVDTANRFKKIGVILMVNPPSQKMIDDYKQTDEYIKAKAEFDKYRAKMNSSRKESEIEKLTKQISKMAGIGVEQVVAIKKREDV